MDWWFLQELDKVPDQYGAEALLILIQRTEEGAKRRFCRLSDMVKNRLDNEFEMIRATNTAKLFLYWADVVSAIKQRTYPYICSVQNCSLVSYCLGITEVNPLLTGSYFERLLNKQSLHVPILFIEVPKGRREELWERLDEQTLIEIEENAARSDLSAKDVSAFFERQTYKGKEILRRAAESLEFEGRIKLPETIRELAELLVYKRYTEFMEEKPLLLYQEDAVDLLVKAGFSYEEADNARRAFAKKNRIEIDFYRDIYLQTARMAGRSVEEANSEFSALEKDSMFTVCRASYIAMAQYLYMDTCFQGKQGTNKNVYKKIDD